MKSRANTHLLVAVHEVHETIVVVIVVGALWSVPGQHEVVGAQPVALCVRIAEDARLQQLVIGVPNACTTSHACTSGHGLECQYDSDIALFQLD